MKQEKYDLVLDMLKRENELRLSPETQELYSRFDDSLNKAIVTENLQKQVAEEFGWDNLENGVIFLRSALSMFPDDETLINSANYLKYNICKNGDLHVGDLIPKDINIEYLDNDGYYQDCKLMDLCNNPHGTVVISGSIT